jgi:uncharacterized protein (DUF362 family)
MTNSDQLKCKVRAVHCDYRSSEEEVYQALQRVTAPLTESWTRLRRARRIGIKFNQDKEPKNRVYFEGQLQQLVSEKVARAFLRLLRERTDAELYAPDVSFYTMYNGAAVSETNTFAQVYKDYDVHYIDGTQPPYKLVSAPGGGQMFRQYLLPAGAVEVDEFISVAKLKNHAFMGVTLSLKNLFGLTPGGPNWRPRTYYHHLVRMPYMLADLGRIFDPVLNVIDGLVGQAGREWGNGREEGPARIANTLVAGDQTIATDACAAHLMGHDPCADWLTPPFHRERSALVVAAEAGFGTVKLDEIDFESEVQEPLAEFYAVMGEPETIRISTRRTAAEQGLYYAENQRQIIGQYANEFILLQGGEVVWHNPHAVQRAGRTVRNQRPDQALWLKYVDPDEQEGEHFNVYEQALAQMKTLVN